MCSSDLSSISLPQSVTTIGSSAFGGCANLKLVEIKNQSIVNALTSQTSAGYIIYNAETIITDATVSASGYVWRNFSCRGSVSYTNVDGETVSFTLYSKHYHNDTSAIWTDISRAPTYTSIGFNGYKCSSCGVVKGEELAALRAYITGSNLTIGSDLTINVYALVDDGFESLAIRFTMNGKSHLITPKKSSGQYKFAFEGVSPQHMNDTVTAELIVNGEVVSTLSNCGVREYCDQLLTYSAEELGYTEEQFASLLILMKDMLAYGAEAQIFTNYNTDSLANEGIEGGSVFEEFECNDKSIIYHNTVDGVGFTAYNLRFDNVNYLYFKFKAPDVSLASVNITVGTKTVTLTADDFERSGDAYIALTDDILATGFGKVYTATLIYDGVEIQSLTYSVNAYAYGKQNQTTEGGELTSMARLARATYLYGKSARAYYDLMKKGQ